MCSAPMPDDPTTQAIIVGPETSPVTDAVSRFIFGQTLDEAVIIGDGPVTVAPRTVTLDYLLLSTGGQYGAFGSGFLQGWGENQTDPRPDFDVVTGASAGGIIAPFALSGAEFDSDLELMAGVGLADVARKRPLIETLFSNSLLDNEPLARRLRAAVDDRLITALKERAAEGRTAFVGAVDLRSGEFETFSLTDLAGLENAEACIEQALLATSAIPGVFPPRAIDGGLYADAGLREHLFIEDVRDAAELARQGGIRLNLNAYIIINGDLDLEPSEVPNSFLPIAQRSAQIVSDAGFRKSILEVLRLNDDTSWTINAITARDVDLSACGKAELFDACVTRALFDAGRRIGLQPSIPWLSAADLEALARE